MTVGFNSFLEFATAQEQGRSRYATWRKSPTQITPPGVWFDLSMSPGLPVPQYYAAAPATATPLARTTDQGLDHGQDPPADSSKHLAAFTMMSNSATGLPMPCILADYLLFYSFIDEGTTDLQTLTNINPLPRYTDDAGVQIMAVSVAGRTGGQTFRVGYTNQAGVSGRFTSTVAQNSVSVNGSIVSSDRTVGQAAGPFLPLQTGDTGVRTIDNVQMVSGVDVGLFALVLVKPLAQHQVRDNSAPAEVAYMVDHGQAPRILSNAYLNLLCCPAASLAATALHGDITTTWS